MFTHNFKYTLKTIFKNKILIFWTFAFPLILGTFFYMAFSNIEESEKLDVIPIAVIQNAYFDEQEIYKSTLETLSEKNDDDRLFDITYTSAPDAEEMLADKKIDAYIFFNKEPKIYIRENGINATIIKQVFDQIGERIAIYTNMIQKKLSSGKLESYPQYDIELLYKELYAEIDALIRDSKADIKDVSKPNLSYTMIEFYTLIAMTCLYGGILGMSAINQNLANMSKKGMRITIGPTPKWVIVLSSALASYVVQLIGLALLFSYTIFVLHVDYGPHFMEILFLSLAGCLAGLTLGLMIASTTKANEDMKTGIIISITMLGSFLSGMMGITMKYIVDKNLPFLNMINPTNMVTDGLYSLYYYGVGNRYFFNIGSLLLFSFIMILVSILCLRRQKYDSI